MQFTAYITYKGDKILLLVRPSLKSAYNAIRIRFSGQDGKHLEDEEIFLSEREYLIEQLKAGKTIKL